MKPKQAVLIIIVLFSTIHSLLAQNKIRYGSNNGKYLLIFNKKIYYEEYGQGTPLILLEGGMKSISDFSLCIPELSKHFRVIAPDDPGQGRSEMLDSMTYDLLAEYVSKLIDFLKLDSAYVMGWSDGGIAGLILAAKRPEKIKRLIASGANYTRSGLISNDSTTNDSLQLLPPDYRFSPEDQKWADEYFIANKSSWRKIINDRIIMWHEEYYFPKDLLNQIHIPVMLVFGDRDIIKSEHGLEMHRLIKGSEYCVLPNTSHAVFTEKPELINKIALEFFSK
jgi:pimeloyl-ACP methyl ester carboxylesterase